MKKLIGATFIVLSSFLFLIFLYNLFFHQDTFVSPIPDEKGVRVIMITPSK
ncbi:hypothetical protein HGB07_03125 [Candidatus Roizmanbacteria bacterium]|nr:hypothetical protein [Candidatus Roizmanbacteria bacterium]